MEMFEMLTQMKFDEIKISKFAEVASAGMREQGLTEYEIDATFTGIALAMVFNESGIDILNDDLFKNM